MPRRASYAFQITYHEAPFPFPFVILRRKTTFPPDLGSCLNDICQEKAEASEPMREDGGPGVPSAVLTASSPDAGKGPERSPHPQRALGRGFQKSLRARSGPSASPPGAETPRDFHDGARTAGGLVHSASRLVPLTNERRPHPGEEKSARPRTPHPCVIRLSPLLGSQSANTCYHCS